MLDLALGTQVGAASTLFLVAPDNLRDEVAQRMRPAKSSTQPRNAWTWCALNLSGHQF